MEKLIPKSSETIPFIREICTRSDFIRIDRIQTNLDSIKRSLITERPDFIDEYIFNKYFIKDEYPINHIYVRVYLIRLENMSIIIDTNKRASFILVGNIDDVFTEASNISLDDLISGISITEQNTIHVKKIFNIAKLIYGEERVDISWNSQAGSIADKSSSTIAITIHYPEVTVEDEDGIKLKIHDLYVILPFTNSSVPKLTSDLMGVRSTLTQIEAQVSYVHSHLERVSIPGTLGRFCQGTGIMPDAFNRALASNYDEIDIYNLFFTIDSFIKWEDEEGVPYIRIKGTYLKQIQEERMSMVSLISNIKEGRIPVRISIESENLVVKIRNEDILSSEGDGGLSYRTRKGTLYSSIFNNYGPYTGITDSFMFKGKVIDIKIIDTTDNIDISELYNLPKVNGKLPHFNHVKYVEETIKSLFYSKKPEKLEIKPYESKHKIPKSLIALKKIRRFSKSNTL